MATAAPGYGHLGRAGLDDQVLGKLYDHTVVVRLFKYVFPYKMWASLALVGMLGYSVTAVAQPLIIAWGLNSFIIPADAEGSLEATSTWWPWFSSETQLLTRPSITSSISP